MSIPRKLLAIEASGRPISLALFEDGAWCVGREKRAEVRHSADLLPMLEDLLDETGWKLGDLEAIAVTRGPGSFTSVRIALATARGLAYPSGTPVYALNSLEVLAAGRLSVEQPMVLAALDARKNQVYAACYEMGDMPRPLMTPRCIDPEEVRDLGTNPLVVTGSGAAMVLPFVQATTSEPDDFPQARVLGRLVLERMKAGEDFESATPLYLRRSEAEENFRKAQDAL